MIRTYKIDENYQTVRVFDEIKKGDISLVPFNEKRHSGIRAESRRRNKDLRLVGFLKHKRDAKYRVSKTDYPGYSAVYCIK